MLNLFDPSGRKLTSIAEKRRLIAPRSQSSARTMGANKIIPFSSSHRYQREDSAWANELIPDLEDYHNHAMKDWPEILPAFVRVDCETREVTPIDPPRSPRIVKNPEEFGDSWSDQLTAEGKGKIRQYFSAREALRKNFGFIEVSGRRVEHYCRSQSRQARCRDRFECPRNSLMSCIEHELFDDLLIGNYMRTTLCNIEALYPNFTPYVAKYGDNCQNDAGARGIFFSTLFHA